LKGKGKKGKKGKKEKREKGKMDIYFIKVKKIICLRFVDSVFEKGNK
jgi:hypothetical protein